MNLTRKQNGKVIFPLVALALLLLMCSCDSRREQTNAAPAAVEQARGPRPEVAKVLGTWDRSDGDYSLVIKSANAEGQMEVEYLNPGPIHVSRALAIPEQGKAKLFIELRDVNYPGCTYSLQYDPSADQLYGTYYQAAMRQTYDVTFARRPDGAVAH